MGHGSLSHILEVDQSKPCSREEIEKMLLETASFDIDTASISELDGKPF